jgi:hypothetical protein
VVLQNNNLQIQIFQTYGRIKSLQHDFIAGNDFYLKAYNLAKQNGFKKIETELLLSLSELNSNHGKFKDAYLFLEEFRRLNEELMDRD